MEKRTGQVRQLPIDDSRTVRFTISDESIDRHNSIVKSEAWDLEAFRENPIAGWSHAVYGGWRAPNPDDIIGTWNVWTEDNELIGDLTFEDEETNPKAEKLLRKVKNGTLSAVSVGFLPHKTHTGDPEKTEGEIEGVTYYDEAELVEASLVVIPSNKNARKKALENGDIPELAEELVEELTELSREALGDEFNIEKLTIKGLLNTLRGGDAEDIEKADYTEVIEKEETSTTQLELFDGPSEEDEREHYKRLLKLKENDA